MAQRNTSNNQSARQNSTPRPTRTAADRSLSARRAVYTRNMNRLQRQYDAATSGQRAAIRRQMNALGPRP